MKTFHIKEELASSLVGLPGLLVRPSYLGYCSVRLLDSHLPRSANSRLVDDFLKQTQFGKANPEKIDLLKEYLHCAEKKDKNNKINADMVNALKEIIYGLFLVMSSAGGVMLTILLTRLFPIYASWITLLFIPLVALALYGGINTLLGVIKLGFEIVSCCFTKNNTGKLPLLEQRLKSYLSEADLPKYEYVQKNNYQFPSTSNTELPPPTYQEAMMTPPTTPYVVNVVTSKANFFQADQNASSDREVGSPRILHKHF